MKVKRTGALIALGFLLFSGAFSRGAVAQDASQLQPAQPAASQTETAANQTPSPSGAITDRELTQKVRKALADDQALSGVARRVKVSAQNGKVTLKGSVDSDEQRQAVEKHASQTAGPSNVTNDITIKAGRAKKSK